MTGTNMTMLRMAHRHAQAAEDLLLMAIHEAIKVNGATWAEIGQALGVSRQAAHKHWHRRVEDLDVELAQAHEVDEDDPPAP